MPLPTSFVVKNGSKARATTSGGMPVPVSLTVTRTYSPGARPAGCWPSATTLPVAMTSRPPSGIASRALTTRFNSADSKRALSIRAWWALRSRSITNSILGLPARRSTVSKPRMIPLRLRVSACSGCWRANASSCWVRRAPRSIARRIDSSVRVSPSPRCMFNTSRPLDSTDNRLLKSCATPPVSWPMDSIFCAWNSAIFAFSSASSAFFFSVRSRVILAKPSSSPSSPRMASSTACAQNREPSLRTRQPSDS